MYMYNVYLENKEKQYAYMQCLKKTKNTRAALDYTCTCTCVPASQVPGAPPCWACVPCNHSVGQSAHYDNENAHSKHYPMVSDIMSKQ